MARSEENGTEEYRVFSDFLAGLLQSKFLHSAGYEEGAEDLRAA